MPCAKTDARLREDYAAGCGGVDLIAEILQRRPSSSDTGDKLGFESKEAGIMVVRRQREGERREQKTRKSTDKNYAAKRGHTADEEKKGRLCGHGRRRTLPAGLNETKPVSPGQRGGFCLIVRRFYASFSTSNLCALP